MRFDLSRQPLVPAFATMLLFIVLTVCKMTSSAPADAVCDGGIPASCGTEPMPGGIRGAGAEAGRRVPTAAIAGWTTDPSTGDRMAGRGTSAEGLGSEAPRAADADGDAGLSGNDRALCGCGDSVLRAEDVRVVPDGTAASHVVGSCAAVDVSYAGEANPGTAPDGSAGGVASPAALLGRFQSASPGWARLCAALTLLGAGLCLGRMTVRRNLYGVGSCIAMPLFGMVLCLLPAGGESLAAYVAALLSALSIRYCGRAYRNGYAFDSIFRAAFCLGAVPLLVPAALPLYLLLPFAALLFRRTVREMLVASFGLLLPVAVFVYVDWGAGEEFATALLRPGVAFLAGVPLDFVCGLPPAALCVLGALAGLSCLAVGLFLTHLYAVGTKARFILLYTLGVLVLTAALLCGPAASPALFPLLAVPVAVLLPLFFVRVRPVLSVPAYAVLALAALAGFFMQ